MDIRQTGAGREPTVSLILWVLLLTEFNVIFLHVRVNKTDNLRSLDEEHQQLMMKKTSSGLNP